MKPILFNTEMVKAILDGRKTVTRRLVKTNIVNQFDVENDNRTVVAFVQQSTGDSFKPTDVAPYKVGDILYVRETYCDRWLPDGFLQGSERYGYKADGEPSWGYWGNDSQCKTDVWIPSIHMPKEAARIFLRVTDVRVERLHDITEEQAVKEGIKHMFDHLSLEEYERWAKRVGEHRKQDEQPWENYLWHGNFGLYGTGNKLSDAWEYQSSGYELARDSFSSLWNTTVELKDWEKYGWGANPWVWVIEFERISKEDATGVTKNE